MGLFTKAIPKKLPELIEAIAKELPWKLHPDGVASIASEVIASGRAKKLTDALDNFGGFQNFMIAIEKKVGSRAMFTTDSAVVEQRLLNAVNEQHNLGANLYKPFEIAAPAEGAIKEAVPSGADLIKRGDQKSGLQY